MIAPDRENSIPAQQVEIASPLSIVQILTLAAAKANVVTNRFKQANHLLVEMAAVHSVTIAPAPRKQLSKIVCHSAHPNNKMTSVRLASAIHPKWVTRRYPLLA